MNKERRTHMNTTVKLIAWTGIFSILFMGCYTASMIDPNGAEKEKIYSGQIKYVVTKDGTQYEFKRPPTVVKDAIVGEAETRVDDALVVRRVSIPTFDVAQLGQSHSGDITYVVTKAGAKYVFEEPAAIVENAVVGKAKLTERGKVDRVHKQEVSIPLSEVVETKAAPSGGIASVVTKGGVEYTFEKPPSVVNKTIVGEAQLGEGQLIVTLPLSDVAKVDIWENDPVVTATFATIMALVGVGLAYAFLIAPRI
jgi:hypothetical protein